MKRTILVFVILFIIAGQGMCFDGNKLLSKCKPALKEGSEDIQKVRDANFCIGFIIGVADTSDSYHQYHNTPDLFCLPTDAKIPHTQLARVVVKYLENHPEQLQYEASSIVMIALKQAFPCKQKP